MIDISELVARLPADGYYFYSKISVRHIIIYDGILLDDLVSKMSVIFSERELNVFLFCKNKQNTVLVFEKVFEFGIIYGASASTKFISLNRDFSNLHSVWTEFIYHECPW